MGYSEARGILIYEKNLMSKISCLTPFKKGYRFSRLDLIRSRLDILIFGRYFFKSVGGCRGPDPMQHEDFLLEILNVHSKS